MGTRLGSFRLQELLGQGGMGRVYLAEQLEPVRRQVAVKLLRESLLDAHHIARFAVEQQALARMSHPAVAQVFDAGTTEDGRPYFAMEHVAGEPLTDFCRGRGHDLTERLELFTKVCWGVQHAHQKGIIHRDLKPSNILVQEVDGRPAPKIIDFGIATAARVAGEGKESSSSRPGFVGTPRYISPEQADSAAEDLDTRSDVYSLGAVLYELLTGHPPIELEERSGWTSQELRRILEETAIPPPSRELRDTGRGLPGQAPRPAEHRHLFKQLRSEVDWIAAKALATDRAQRYSTAAALAEDVEAFLGGRPVEAVPPSRRYRLSKIARRHKAMLAAAAAVTVALIAGLGLATWGFLQAHEQRDIARQAEAEARFEAAKSERVAAFIQEMLAGVDPAVAGDLDKTLLRILLEAASAKLGSELASEPEVAAAIHTTIGNTFLALGGYAQAVEHLELAAEMQARILGGSHPDTLATRAILARTYSESGEYPRAEAILRQVIAAQETLLGEDHPGTLESLGTLANLYSLAGRLDEAEKLFRATAAASRKVLGPEHPLTLNILNNLATLLDDQGRFEESEPIYLEGIEVARRVLGPDHPQTLSMLNNLALLYKETGQLEKAEPLYVEVLEKSRLVLGSDHPETWISASNLATFYSLENRFDAAEPLLQEVLEARRLTLGPSHPDTLSSLNNLSSLYRRMGRYHEAVSLSAEAVREARKGLSPDHWLTGTILSSYGAALAELDRFDEAEAALAEAAGILERALGADHGRAVTTARWLAELRERRRQ